MKRLLLTGFLIAIAELSFGQETNVADQQRLSILETQIQNLQKQLQENSTNEVLNQLEELKKQRVNQPGQGDTLEKQIQTLTANLAAKEKAISDLQQNLTSLTSQITAIITSEKTAQVDKQKAEELEKQAKQAKEKFTTVYVTNYVAYVSVWWDLGNTLAASTITSKTLLIFPNAKTEPIWQSITKYIGIAGGVVGPILYSRADTKSEQTTGVLTAGISLSVTGLVTAIFKNKNSQRTLENIGRNVAFTDDVITLNNIATQFKDKATALYEEIKINKDKRDWKPTLGQLKTYYSLISLRRDLTVAIRQMKAKAEFLQTQAITEEGKEILNRQIQTYKDALASWESLEVTYLDTYNYLYNLSKEE